MSYRGTQTGKEKVAREREKERGGGEAEAV